MECSDFTPSAINSQIRDSYLMTFPLTIVNFNHFLYNRPQDPLYNMQFAWSSPFMKFCNWNIGSDMGKQNHMFECLNWVYRLR
jgi:hypothetical protein